MIVKGTRFVKDLFDEFFQTDNDDDTRDHSLETSPEEKKSVKTGYPFIIIFEHLVFIYF